MVHLQLNSQQDNVVIQRSEIVKCYTQCKTDAVTQELDLNLPSTVMVICLSKLTFDNGRVRQLIGLAFILMVAIIGK